jgi:hypothetical protein
MTSMTPAPQETYKNLFADAYRLGVNSFLVKPYDFMELVEFAKMIQEFWLTLSKTPESFRAPHDAGAYTESTNTAKS